MLKDVCSDLKKDVRKLEHANEVLKSERLEIDEKTLVFPEDFNKPKETLSMSKEVFNTDLSKLESESLRLKQRIGTLICENNQLLKKLEQVESDLAINRRWNSSLEGLKWLNTHHNQNKKGLGFMTKRTVIPVNRKYVGL